MIKEIDNFSFIADKFFDETGKLPEGEFYYIQILIRGKDGHNVSGNNKNRLIKYYTVTNREQFLNLKDEIIAISKAVNARVYIHPTKRSFKTVAGAALELATHSYVTENHIGLKSIFSTAAGISYITKDKKFIVDLDDIDINTSKGKERYDNIVKALYECRGAGGPNSDKVFLRMPTKSGMHLITYPFDVDEFKKKFPEIDVHKNNPTLLYFSWEE